MLAPLDPSRRLYRALADQIRLLIIDGRVPVGARLPSERDLAMALGRSRSTVVAAYLHLRDAGYLTSRQGSGSIAALPAGRGPTRPVDLAHAVPPPIPGLGDYIRRAVADPARVLSTPGFDLVGDELLRSRVAHRYTSRSVPTEASHLVITLGAQHALAWIARTLLRPGDRVVMDSPCYPHAYEAFHAAGGRIVATPVTWQGWDIEHLLGLLHRFRPALAYVMPDFQNPTGASMPQREREALVAAAARGGTTLVVDETTADLDISRGWSLPPLAALAAAHEVDIVTVGSLSKSMWGGLRLGWVRAEPAVIQRLVRRRPTFDLGTSRLDQLVAAELVPDLDRLLTARARQLQQGRDHLAGMLRGAFPDWQVPEVDGGLSLWVRLEHPVASSLAVRAHARGLVLSAGPRFSIAGSHERFVRLPFTESLEELSRAVAILRTAWSDVDVDVRNAQPIPDCGTVV